jgi:hypothetical protein
MKIRTILALTFLALFAVDAAAQTTTVRRATARHQTVTHKTVTHRAAAPAPDVVVAQPAPQINVPPAPPAQVVVQSTYEAGTMIGEVLKWLAAVFGPIFATVATGWLYMEARKLGIDVTDADRARAQEILVNGLHVGAAEAAEGLAGKGEFEIRNNSINRMIAYGKDYGLSTFKRLGMDPTTAEGQAALRDKAMALIANPDVATPKLLDFSKLVAAAPAADAPPIAPRPAAPAEGQVFPGKL